MQTFLPYPSFHESVKVLDYRRLGKQRVEANQILRILNGENPHSRYRNHPAVNMWRGYEEALKLYINLCITEWISRGYRNTMRIYEINLENLELPPWFGDENFHLSHRSNLVRKKPEHYTLFFGNISPRLPYIWPVRKND